MAELENVTLDGRPLDSLRVTDLRTALEERGLAKSGPKSTLMKRLKGALMLENLQKHSTPHTGFQPNSQMGEEMGQNSFIKQYLEKQQELLRQRLQKEAREAQDTEESLAESEEENTNPDIVPEPPDIICSVLKVPDVELGKRPPRKSISVLEDPEDSEEEIPKKRGRRSSRVKQAKTSSKPPVLTPPAQEQEARRSSTRVRRSKGEIAKEEAEDVGEEEGEEIEEKELPVEKDEEETPKRRRSARSATIHQKKSPKVKRSPSPPELSETVSKSISADSEEMAEERVPPLLSLEGFQHQVSEKQVTAAAEKAVTLQFLHKESSKSHRSPQKWGRHVRERSESSSDPSAQQPPATTCVIQQTPNWGHETRKAKPKMQDSHMTEETGSMAGTMTRGATTKDIKVKSSLVLMKPPVRSKSEGKAYVSEQSLHIVEKSSSRGVQAMSILEKQEPESHENKDSTITLSSCSEVGRSNVKTMSILEKEIPCNKSSPERKNLETLSPETLHSETQPVQDSSPPLSPKVSKFQQDVPIERRRTYEMPEDTHEQEHIKRIRLEPQSDVQDHRCSVQREHEVEEEQKQTGENVATEREEAIMDVVENQAEGELQETAKPQNQEEACETDEKKESTTTPPRTFKRKISVISATKGSGQAASTAGSDSEGHPARRRRWGASTATTQKKPSISISTDSLKSLIPEIKEIKQEAVVDLHAEDARISEDEGERNGEDNSHDKGLKICRTVTQVVPAEVQENGQDEEEEEKRSEEAAEVPDQDPVPIETETPPPNEQEVKKPLPESPAPAEVRVTLGDTLLRRSISQQKTGVSITIDDPVRTASQQPSPPRRKPSCIVHVCNLVRPFTLGQLKELLSRTGTMVEEHFWIDKIKSHCYVTYSTMEEAVATRNSLHGVKWPQSNPKFLSVDFAAQDELDFHRGLLVERPPEPKQEEPPHPHSHAHPHIPPLRGEHREHERGVREQWAEREREMERRERTRSEREWDRDKVREGPRSRSRDRRRKEHAKSKEKKNEKKERVQEEPPAKLLDDLFHKTKAIPCIYWLPLTDDQALKRVAERAERAKEREKKRKELEEQEEEERKERAKEREKAERNRERAREAEREKRREHSREHPRERERRDPKRHSRSRSRSTPVRDRGGRR